jgi:hypothetical protein
VLFLITFATSIPALLLFQPVLDDPVGYVANGGSDNRILFGALLELLLIIANIGTAVVVYPILKRENHILSLGYVTARIVEGAFILVGILAVLSIVTLSQQDAGGEEGAIAYALAALKDWTFILGPGWVVGWGNGLILGYLMYRSGLVPRPLAMFGLVGGPLIVLSGTRRDVRRRRPARHGPGSRHHSRVHLGVGARHLRDHLGIQAVSGPRGYERDLATKAAPA